MKLRPYLSLDLETTGLDTKKSQILQIGWVLDDGVSPVSKLKRGTCLIENRQINYGENFAIGMNSWIFQELMKKDPATRKYPTKDLFKGLFELFAAIEEAATLAAQFDVAEGRKGIKKVQLAGKNVAPFDWPIVLNNLKTDEANLTTMELYEECVRKSKYVDHRFIDVGGLFFEEFGKNPGFSDITKLMKRSEITHDALGDALEVVIAIRFKMKMYPEEEA